MPTITPCLWFDDNAEEAMDLYCGIFPEAKVSQSSRYGEGAPMPAGTLLTAVFEIAGQRVMVLNGGPAFTPDEAFSFYVGVETQAEIDHYWDALIADGGQPSQCGWLKDRFGVSWQIVPSVLGDLLADPDPERSGRTMQVMLSMGKLDIAELQRAHAGT
jgi:predicted 3-demethylubiquinone-9 3-methyltransferase (glyoxalase superfamily)